MILQNIFQKLTLGKTQVLSMEQKPPIEEITFNIEDLEILKDKAEKNYTDRQFIIKLRNYLKIHKLPNG
ncbi:hypothetical protein ATZ36_00915 [Candidatus Endomicrobiellum trichonymphae]|uniref:Uncharacterized protein n=1 Tax=Endomicrobium trichonymphae TaxID=1408204 RepID=A0A1E5IJ97_ENDTX|nr:hypothetical protein ATZ36_00915 [Candidatus Endomicrobium trichonymphae]